mmetsp:Transcript_9590/g.23525  ORF Transcript_9590/g.23525 Transcript_9590/m.23525 type:complete len:697 (-) Transcript_9590:1273-3363(-)|eukprot:CAMPEP_0179000030 /NCGR_PEP_ID=MMETSP0795-20121207/10427_1 /TAXON_ID=88552 /ORGANISM="Amoebophrya sp., Strain Ameob2" /LENGTH=696 /DNA_ID=CAMNT_0020692945 /DNA_START=42 /DNA_END=2132 /DNA_ORIENTATION=-
MGKHTQPFNLDPATWEFGRVLGSGSYGTVQSYRNKKTEQKVAVKRIGNAFDDFLITRRTLREIKLMRHFKHQNIIGIKDVFVQDADKVDEEKVARNAKIGYAAPRYDLYLLSELADYDLDAMIRSKREIQPHLIQQFAFQMLLGLKFLHKGHVIHRDLKPANIFVTRQGTLKIGDLGLARAIDLDESGDPNHPECEALTEYVVTRWYRAPEIIILRGTYGPVCDVWAVGCILAELVGRRVLLPGTSSREQLKEIFKICGMHPCTEWLYNTVENPNPHAKRKSMITEAAGEWARKVIVNISEEAGQQWPSMFNNRNPESVEAALHRQRTLPGGDPIVPGRSDYKLVRLPSVTMQDYRSGHKMEPLLRNLVCKMLQFSPETRITVDEALDHMYFNAEPKYQEERHLAQTQVQSVQPIDMQYDLYYDNRGMDSKNIPASFRNQLADQLLAEVENVRIEKEQKEREAALQKEKMRASGIRGGQQAMQLEEPAGPESGADRPSRRGSRQLGLLPNEQQQLVEQCTMVQQKQNKKISPAELSTAANSANNSAAPSAAHSRQNSISFQPHEACQLQDGLLKGVATATGGGYQHGGMNLMPNSARMNRGAQSQHQFDQNLLSNRLQTRPLMLQQPTLQPEVWEHTAGATTEANATTSADQFYSKSRGQKNYYESQKNYYENRPKSSEQFSRSAQMLEGATRRHR